MLNLFPFMKRAGTQHGVADRRHAITQPRITTYDPNIRRRFKISNRLGFVLRPAHAGGPPNLGAGPRSTILSGRRRIF